MAPTITHLLLKQKLGGWYRIRTYVPISRLLISSEVYLTTLPTTQKNKTFYFKNTIFLVRLPGVEPGRIAPRDFKSLVSTYSTIDAFGF